MVASGVPAAHQRAGKGDGAQRWDDLSCGSGLGCRDQLFCSLVPIELPIDFARRDARDGERGFVPIAEAASDGRFGDRHGCWKAPAATP